MPRDYLLDNLSERINNINEQLAKVQAEIKKYEEIKKAVDSDISYEKSEREEARREADCLFEYARDCTREYRDFAENYRAEAMSYMERVKVLNERIDDSYAELNDIIEKLQKLNTKRKSLKAERNSLIEQHKERVQQLKAQNALNWCVKPCAAPRCNGVVRYNVTWKHIPNFCPKCKEKFRSKPE